jgi:adhesin transport system membrane fusion protein
MSNKLDDEHVPYPRAQDRIVRQAHHTFVVATSIAVCIVIVWAGATELDRVTRGSGRIVPQMQNQTIQHLEGGIVSEILLKEGDRVEAGKPIMRIQNSGFDAELAQSRIERKAEKAKLRRLDAELSQNDAIDWPADLVTEMPEIVAGETAIFQRRKAQLQGEQLILDDQIKQKTISISELRARAPMVQRERSINQERYDSLQKLMKIGAVSNNELLETEHQLQESIARQSGIAHDIPRTEAELDEIKRRKTEVLQTFQVEAEGARQETVVKLAKLDEAIGALQERNTRSDVIAPVSGRINKLYVSTVGGVAKAGAPLAELVPEVVKLSVDMRLKPSDRADVWIGQTAITKITAFEYSDQRSLPATVVEISPDALQDERGQLYFRVRLEADGAAIGLDRPILPGMIADVRLLAGRHSVLSFILKPLRTLSENALR